MEVPWVTRYSPLSLINTAIANRLGLEWSFDGRSMRSRGSRAMGSGKCRRMA